MINLFRVFNHFKDILDLFYDFKQVFNKKRGHSHAPFFCLVKDLFFNNGCCGSI